MLKRLLHKLLYVIVFSMAAFATAVIWLWPQMPIWRSPPKVAQGNGTFSPDGNVFVTSMSSGSSNPQTFRLDANTGKLLSHTKFACKDPNMLRVAYPSPDGRRALIGEGHPPSPSMGVFQL